jgi:hypothetical protein
MIWTRYSKTNFKERHDIATPRRENENESIKDKELGRERDGERKKERYINVF